MIAHFETPRTTDSGRCYPAINNKTENHLTDYTSELGDMFYLEEAYVVWLNIVSSHEYELCMCVMYSYCVNEL